MIVIAGGTSLRRKLQSLAVARLARALERESSDAWPRRCWAAATHIAGASGHLPVAHVAAVLETRVCASSLSQDAEAPDDCSAGVRWNATDANAPYFDCECKGYTQGGPWSCKNVAAQGPYAWLCCDGDKSNCSLAPKHEAGCLDAQACAVLDTAEKQ